MVNIPLVRVEVGVSCVNRQEVDIIHTMWNVERNGCSCNNGMHM